MIAVRIPKEIRAYKEKLILGFTLRQALWVIIGFVICVPTYFFGVKYINEELLSWFILLIACLCGGIGFFTYHGMAMEKVILAVIKQMIYPAKRKFATQNCFRTWQDMISKEDAVKIKEKDIINASLERCVLMMEAEASGEEVGTTQELNEKLLTVRTSSSPNSPKNKKSKKSKEDKEEKNKKSRLEIKAEAIKEKQKANPKYAPTKSEFKILRKWEKKKQQIRIAEINKKKKQVASQNTKMKQRRKPKTAIPRSVQDTIPYIADYDEGLFEVEPNVYSKLYVMDDINYLVSNNEEQVGIFCKYGEFLNQFSDDVNVQIILDSRIVSTVEQENRIFYQLTGDELDPHREEMNRILKRQIMAGKNNIQLTKYIAVTIKEDSPMEALLRFHKVDNEVLENLRRIGSGGRVLSTEERLSLLHDKFRRGREGDFGIDFDFLKEQGISSKDYIAPSSFDFGKASYFQIEEEYYRCLFLNNLPASLSDDFLSKLVDVEFPLITNLNIQPVAQDKALRLVRKQLTGMEANIIEAEKKAIRAGYSPENISHDLKQSYKQAEELLDDLLNKNQKLFYLTIGLMVNGHTKEELEENCKTLMGKARSATCQLQSFDYQQEDAFKVIMPMGVPPKGHINVERALTTESTSIFMPFTSQELFQEGGFYYGLNQISRNLILCNRTAMKTPSGFILGSSGSGKSFATKREILNVLLNSNKTNVIVIDPENEYGDFARFFGGTVIKMSADTDNHMNPMDMPEDYGVDDEDDIENMPLQLKKEKATRKKTDFLMSIIEKMITVGENGTTITPQQKTLIDRCVKLCYSEYLDNDFDLDYLPTLKELQDELDKDALSNEFGKSLAEGTAYYTKGSMDAFAHYTNVEYNNRFVVFNVRDLGGQIKQIALIVIFDFIWNRLITNKVKGIRTYCYCDEIHVMFETPYAASFLKQLYKRGRKYGLVITGITQNVEDLLKSDMARSMIGNSDFVLMLNQYHDDLMVLADMLNISPAQTGYVDKADIGCGLLFAEKTIVPFIDKFPEDSYLYTLISTRFDEKMDAQEFVKAAMENKVHLPPTDEEIKRAYSNSI